METKTIERAFEKMGARVKFQTLRPSFYQRRALPFTVDVKRFGRNEFFELGVEEGADVEFRVLQNDPAERHMLLMASQPTYNRVGMRSGSSQSRFLVGHDERHWFAAGIGEAVSTVKAAKDSLKPAEVRELEHGVKSKNRHNRRNEVRVRQGEWFFVPDPSFVADKKLIMKNEPLSRGRGSKPHICQEAVRFGGENVYVKDSSILTPGEYEKLKTTEKMGYQLMRRDAATYVRGTVRHSDHKTIYLDCWHRVRMNSESNLFGAVTFLD